MTREQIDALWQQALRENDARGTPTVAAFASLIESDVLLRVIQRLNQNPYSLTKSECLDVVREMRSTLTGGAGEQP